MSYFLNGKVSGSFTEKTYGKSFEFRITDNQWAIQHGYNLEIAVGPLGETRPAKILKTVAYVVVDEDQNGLPIVEKWSIKKQWDRTSESLL